MSFARYLPHAALGAALGLIPIAGAGAQAPSDSGAITSRDSVLASRHGYARSRRTAVVLGSAAPGAGHLYAGEWLEAYPILALTGSEIALGAVVFQLDRCTFDWSGDCRSGVAIGTRVLGAAMVGAGIMLWVASARDAGRAVERQRARRAAPGRRALAPIVMPGGARGQRWNVGVSIGS